jgi:dipeptidyl aminopeptidase/acylaminoacyl peptidase
VRTEEVRFYSEGARVAALWRTPDRPPGRCRTIVQGPGWLGLKDAQLYLRYHQALTAAGFAVLIIDYRGFGGSEGEPTVSPFRQLQDLRNAVTYLETRDDVDLDALGTFGSGGTGGGNAVLLAAADSRMKAAVSQLPVADGADWLHRMRTEHDWTSFLQALQEDRRARVITGQSRLVNPREEIMVPTPERRATRVKADVDTRVPARIPLAAVDEILDYSPVAAARTLTTPLLVIGVEGDTTTPADHAVALYEAARGPRELILQRHTSHYASYEAYGAEIAARIVEWFDRHLRGGHLVVRSHPGPDGAGGA